MRTKNELSVLVHCFRADGAAGTRVRGSVCLQPNHVAENLGAHRVMPLGSGERIDSQIETDLRLAVVSTDPDEALPVGSSVGLGVERVFKPLTQHGERGL